MRSSLQNRIFVATALVAVASLGSAIPFIAGRITREGEAELRRGLLEAAEHAERHHAARLDTLTLVARLIADLPILKAVIDTGDAATVQLEAEQYRAQATADLLTVTDRVGRPLAVLGTRQVEQESVQQALHGRTVVIARLEEGRLLEQVTVPVAIGIGSSEVLGSLSMGLALDAGFAARIKAATSSEVAIVFEGQLVASTTPLPAPAVVEAAGRDGVTIVRADDVEYAAMARSLSATAAASPETFVVILRSPTERLRFLRAMRTGLIGAGVIAGTLAVLLSYAVARTVARPLASVTATMREMTASGDLSRPLPAGGRWDDEDALVLTATFGALTASIRRFQQEAALKERLSALGRLSTVVAHEVRNPLMIIRASLRTLARQPLTDPERAEAVADIDQEVTRLDRMVRDVLEFTRPVTVERMPTDLGTVCRDAAAALEHEGTKVTVSVDPELPPVATDGERLRRALVNLLTNARDAVASSTGSSPPIELRASRLNGRGAVLEVEDRGVGIGPDELAQVFEPYFSTKRTGTGLGLAIARNVVESLGGTISARSRRGEGTVMRIELPGS
jgi:signal transduction histidine kinase